MIKLALGGWGANLCGGWDRGQEAELQIAPEKPCLWQQRPLQPVGEAGRLRGAA